LSISSIEGLAGSHGAQGICGRTEGQKLGGHRDWYVGSQEDTRKLSSRNSSSRKKTQGEQDKISKTTLRCLEEAGFLRAERLVLIGTSAICPMLFVRRRDLLTSSVLSRFLELHSFYSPNGLADPTSTLCDHTKPSLMRSTMIATQNANVVKPSSRPEVFVVSPDTWRQFVQSLR
jgi:hypothetical protein